MSNWTKEEVDALKASNGGGNANNMKRFFATLPVSSSVWPNPNSKEGERKEFILSAYCDKSWYLDSPQPVAAEMSIEASLPNDAKAATMAASMPCGESKPFSDFHSVTATELAPPLSAANKQSEKLDDTLWSAFDMASEMAFETVPQPQSSNPNLASILNMFDVNAAASAPPAKQCHGAPTTMSNGTCTNSMMPAGAAAMASMNIGYGMAGLACTGSVGSGIPFSGICGSMPMGGTVNGMPMGGTRGGMSMGRSMSVGTEMCGMPMGSMAMPANMPMGSISRSKSVGTGLCGGTSMGAGIGAGFGSTAAMGMPTLGALPGVTLTASTVGNVKSASFDVDFPSMGRSMSVGSEICGMPMGSMAMPANMPMGSISRSKSVGTGLCGGTSMGAGIGAGFGSTAAMGMPTQGALPGVTLTASKLAGIGAGFGSTAAMGMPTLGALPGVTLTASTVGNVKSASLDVHTTAKVDAATHDKPVPAVPDPFVSLLGNFTDFKVRTTSLAAH
eukprot:CAMPEP_0119343790 /NCGR_PEP_ID=MMETSP1333-20130426/106636_1 /TAXON_ID=418940 /ORGANISM="Scyphosphaera apsteinii, Strain RCC1455" /LENGTH=502 /DNA_ID=CAMNT_0007356205 /DNA_START=31 /DNA_END=1540 /DNA_ORIENTATION=-